jgi:antitoxin component YwqK of YwqJK toxin-antitoxin module
MNMTMVQTAGALVAFLIAAAACTKPAKQPELETADFTVKTRDPDKMIRLKYYPNGKLRSVIVDVDSTQIIETFFVDSTGLVGGMQLKTGAVQQHVVEYYPNGKPMGLVNLDSTSTGDAFYYYPNGQRSTEGRLINGKSSGVWMNYDKDGTLTRIDTLK